MKWPKVGKGKGSDDKAAEGQAPQAEEAMGTGAEKHSAPDEQAHSEDIQAGAAKSDEVTTDAVQAELRAFAPVTSQEAAEPSTVPEEPEEDMFDTTMRYAEQDRQEEEEQAVTAPTSEGQALESSPPDESEAPVTDETDLGPEAEKEVVRVFRGSFRKSNSAREEAFDFVLDRFFNGKLDRTTNPNKHTSFQRVCKELENEITPQALSSGLRAADFRRKRKALGKDLSNVTFPQDVELVAVEDEEKRMALAEKINRSHISIQDLRKRVREVNAKEAPDKDLKRVMRKLKDPFSLPGGKEFEDLVSDPEKLEKDLSKTERKGLRKSIPIKKEQIESCLKRLEDLEEWLGAIDPIDDPES